MVLVLQSYINVNFSVQMNFLKACYAGVAGIFQIGATTSSTGSPLPRQQHVQIPLVDIKKRLVIIGDVHGCLDELKKLLEQVNYDPETTTVILVGDMMVKGPNSVGVVRFVRDKKFLSVRGNHEDNTLIAYHDRKSEYGKKREFQFVSELSREDVDFIRELPVTILIPELSLMVVHAGVHPHKSGIHKQEFSDLIRIRCVDVDGKSTKKGPKDGEQRTLWGGMYQGPPYIVFGHDSKRKLQVHPWARGLDTGCAYGGSLSALVINDTRDTQNWIDRSEIVSVQSAKVYCVKDED
jgi:predicted phosphodiesterase